MNVGWIISIISALTVTATAIPAHQTGHGTRCTHSTGEHPPAIRRAEDRPAFEPRAPPLTGLPIRGTIEQEAKMSKTGRRILTICIAYYIMGMISFGWCYNHNPPTVTRWHEIGSFLAGVFWPVYFTGQIALRITAWP